MRLIRIANELFRDGKYLDAKDLYQAASKLYGFPYLDLNVKLCEKKQNLIAHDAVEVVEADNEVKISVVMPVFNVAPYLDACILSVRNQSYKNLEIIIVNDASTDNGLDIIRMHESLDDRIIVIDLEYNTLGGAGIPSNIGMDKASGKYIAFADSDDILDADAIEKMYFLAESTVSDLIIADFCNFSEDDRKVVKAYDKDKWHGLPLNKPFSPQDYPSVFRLSPVPWRKMYRRDFLNKNSIYFPEGDYFFEDNPLHWFAISQAGSIALLDHVVAFHRMGREGQTMSSGAYKLSALLSHINTIRRIIKDKPDKYIEEFITFAMQTRWIVNRQPGEQLQNIFKKRLFQEIDKLDQSSYNITPQDKKRLSEFSSAYPDLDLTIVILNNNDTKLDKMIKSLDSMQNIKFNIYVISRKDITADEISETKKKSKHNILYFNIYNNTNRIRNSIIPICIGKYSIFIDSEFQIDNNFEKNIIYTKKNKLDMLYHDILNTHDLNNYFLLIRTNHMRDLNIFFGPSQYSDFSFFWTSFLKTKKKKMISAEANKRESELFIDNYECIIAEINNIQRSLNSEYVSKHDYRTFLAYTAKLISGCEDRIDMDSWNKNFENEFKILDNFHNIKCLKKA